MENSTARAEAARNPPVEIRAGLLARNTILNLVGNVVPLAVGLVTIPYVVRRLGSDGFGILSLGWVLLGYFSLFDLGLGRATTKFVAEALGRGELHRLPSLVWTSLGYQLIFGAVGSVIIGAGVPLLVDHILKVPPQLVHETKVSFWLLAASLPVVLATTALRSVLESAQRFDWVNYVKVPASVSVFLLPAIALGLGFRLPGIILLLVLSRLGATIAYLVLCLKLFPQLRRRFSMEFPTLRPLLMYGGWVTVSGIVSPLLVNVDRFVIGALVSMTAVGFYTAPAEIVGRLTIFPGSLVTTLFPAFSSLEAGGAKERVGRLYGQSVKFLLLTLGPALALLAALAHEILRLWLGNEFALQSTLVLQVMAVGVLLNSLALIPYSLIQGLGRPDVTAKFHLLELPLYIALAWVLVKNLGLPGAALAWTLRMGLDALLLFGAAWRLKLATLQVLKENGVLSGLAATLVVSAAIFLTWRTGLTTLGQATLTIFWLTLFAAVTWAGVLNGQDRAFLLGAAGRLKVAFLGTAGSVER